MAQLVQDWCGFDAYATVPCFVVHVLWLLMCTPENLCLTSTGYGSASAGNGELFSSARLLVGSNVGSCKLKKSIFASGAVPVCAGVACVCVSMTEYAKTNAQVP